MTELILLPWLVVLIIAIYEKVIAINNLDRMN